MIQSLWFFAAVVVVILILCIHDNVVVGWTIPTVQQKKNNGPSSQSRRQLLLEHATGNAAALLSVLLFPGIANAACLPGDLSPECIGVYKIPIESAHSSSFLNTEEALKKNAPDVKYVKPVEQPKSVTQAIEILKTQRLAADDIEAIVLSGKLEEAGIKVLNLIPKVTTAGNTVQTIVQKKYSSSTATVDQMRITKFEQMLNEMIVLWSQVDIEIGQAIRGQTGMAVAQITLLKTIKDAIIALDDFIVAVEKSL